MRKVLIIFYAVFFIINAACEVTHDALAGLSIRKLSSNNYTYGKNWSDIVKNNAEFYIYYKTGIFRSQKYIAEIYYVLINQQDEKTILGSFSKKTGFLDAKRYNFTTGGDADFMKNQLIGLSIETLERPFSIRGFALSSDNDVYTTEVMVRLVIDTENMTIEEWFPEW
ncbi:hypothetical protein E4N70_05115 [Treponema vincentii]|uniref:hypothetical protein n=1 Tax=Treponema vincentii TaxID=69710 RepID=UPI0020A52656|nr:hypothetical protein [Treponema vincentii]UTC60938.1 hypothetical protein E4N70_05115 [Treponema vincentii]